MSYWESVRLLCWMSRSSRLRQWRRQQGLRSTRDCGRSSELTGWQNHDFTKCVTQTPHSQHRSTRSAASTDTSVRQPYDGASEKRKMRRQLIARKLLHMRTFRCGTLDLWCTVHTQRLGPLVVESSDVTAVGKAVLKWRVPSWYGMKIGWTWRKVRRAWLRMRAHLRKAHAYYYQVQCQLFVCGHTYGDSVVWTQESYHCLCVATLTETLLYGPRSHITVCVWPHLWRLCCMDPEVISLRAGCQKWSFVGGNVAQTRHFFQVGVLPELLDKCYTRPPLVGCPVTRLMWTSVTVHKQCGATVRRRSLVTKVAKVATLIYVINVLVSYALES